MAEARDRAAWNRTCALLAQLYNANRAEGSQPIDPMQFFPWHDESDEAPAPPPTPEQERMLERMFGGKD